MPQPIKQIKNRIRSISNTRKVTSAMEMISVAKLNRIDHMLFAIRPYVLKLITILKSLAADTEHARHPFFETNNSTGRVLLCVVTSDNGLCGTYNHTVIRVAEEFILKRGKENVKLVAVGRKGFGYFRSRGFNIEHSFLGLNGKFHDESCKEITALLLERFSSGGVDEVYIAYMHFQTAVIQRPVVEKFLNIEPAKAESVEYIFEPERSIVFESLCRKYVLLKIRLILLEAFTSEHASRTIAMKQATDNAKELLDALTLLRNKMRQANITQEIMEIISSAEALKG